MSTCRVCGWKPTVRPRRLGNQPTAPDWRDVPGVMSVLFACRPDLARAATAGARLFASFAENA